MMKTIGIAGGSGFVGRHIAPLLVQEGFEVIIFSRGKAKQEGKIQFANWHPEKKEIDETALAKVQAMINLAGAGVTTQRWTDAYKKEIISSRVDATHFLQDALRKHAPECTTYIATSATGFYGPDRPDSIPFKEEAPPYSDFLGEVCRLWEEASWQASAVYRTVIFRLGIVLGKDGGAYPELSGPMKFGVMPIIGGGRQMVSWIHVDDVVRMMQYALDNEKLSGIYNAVSPEPISHKALMQAIASAKGGLKIPVPVPGFGLKILMGESSIEVLKSCTASAEKISDAGFKFSFPTIQKATKALAL